MFAVIAAYRAGDIINAAKKVAAGRFEFPRVKGRTFRILFMDRGRLAPVPDRIVAAAEKNISRQTRLIAHRAAPDVEFWVYRTDDGAVFFMLRTEKHPPFEKILKKGELRPDVADVMAREARITEGSVVADPFGGWGAVAAAVVCGGRYGEMHTGDIDAACVGYQKKRFRGAANCYVKKWDALALPFTDGTVDAVVTDPPWGAFTGTDTETMTERFLNEAARILKPGGRLVMLVSGTSGARGMAVRNGFAVGETEVKVNGRDARLLTTVKRK